jgi:hypothetical protein
MKMIMKGNFKKVNINEYVYREEWQMVLDDFAFAIRNNGILLHLFNPIN